MSKKPTPKKQLDKSRSRSRSSKYDYEQRSKLSKKIQLTTCSNCGAKRRIHYACEACGFYRGRQVLNVKTKSAPKAEIEA